MIDLKLDTHTIRQLFPEGTEIRSALQQSVIQNIVKELVLKDSDNKIRKAIEQEISLMGSRIPNVNAEVKHQLESFFVKKGWKDIESTLKLDEVMRKEAAQVASHAIQDQIVKIVKEATDKLENRIEETLKLTEKRWEDMIVSRINHNFGIILDKAIAKRIEAAFPEVAK
jgi:hypothetical protein